MTFFILDSFNLQSEAMQLTLSTSWWFIILCLGLGILFAFLLYQKKKEQFSSTWLFYLLFFLRSLTVATIAFLLLTPIIRYLQNQEEKPTIAILTDNSASLQFAFKKYDSIAYRKDMQALSNELAKDFNVKTYSFGAQLHDSLRFDYKEQGSSPSNALESIMTSLENENVGAIIMSSDGIYNEGTSPLSLQYPFKGAVYTIGIGDTTIQKDAFIARAFANKSVYLGDKFAIRSDMAAFGCEGKQVSIQVFSHKANRIVAQQQVNVNNNRFSKSIETILDASSTGLHRYTISVTKIDGEQNTTNNSQDVLIEVLDNKESILIIGNAPHPDINALKEILTKNKNYQVNTALASTVNSVVTKYNLIILHNLPSVKYNMASLLEQARKQGISLWFITGSQTAIPLFNAAQSCLQITPRGLSSTDAQASLNKQFSYFTLSSNNNFSQLPPLASPFGDFKNGVGVQTLMYQKLGSVQTNYPLWSHQQTTNQRVSVLAGEGYWRWRLYDFQLHKNYNLTDEYVLKTAQYLSVKQDKRPFRTQLNKTTFSENELITIDAELYNNNYELINTPEVTLTLIDEANKKTSASFNKNSNSYSIQLSSLAAGKYQYVASTAFNGKSYSSSGSFTIIEQNIETNITTADFGMLNQLSKNYDGKFIFPQQIQSLADSIRANKNLKSILRSHVEIKPLIDLKWLFGLLLLLLASEWFIRKRSGHY
ncbi:MAG: hypothetical protein R2831_11640 [Chitinophagaceae bacterium]